MYKEALSVSHQDKSSLSQAASTAHTVYGAVKTGKVIASYDNVDLWYYETVKFSEGLAILPLADGENYAESTHYIAVDKSGKTVYSYMDQYVDFENGYQNGLVAVAEQAEWGTPAWSGA